MRIKNKAHIEAIFRKYGIVWLESDYALNGNVRVVLMDDDSVRCEGLASEYEIREITTLKDAIDYVWKERKRYIEE